VISRIVYLTKRKDETVDYGSTVVTIMAVDVMDMDGVGDMQVFMRTIVAGGVRKIAIDMEKLAFIDSSGISVLIEAAKLLRQSGGDIVLLHVPPAIQMIFQPIRLNRFIRSFENEKDMRAYFLVT
jgi:anti-anti-sigma factor